MMRKKVCRKCEVTLIMMLNSKLQGFGKVSNFELAFSVISNGYRKRS